MTNSDTNLKTYFKIALLTILVGVLVFVQTMPIFATVTVDKSGPVDIIRLAGDNRYETSIEIAEALKDELKVSKFKNIVLASGEDFPDALSGSYLASVKSAPILLISEGKAVEVVNYVRKNLVKNGTVYILGGEKAVPSSIEGYLTGLKVKRLEGSDRYATNIEILKEADALSGKEIMICCGSDYPDALAAAATGRPIILVASNLKPEQIELLKKNKDKNFYIVGGDQVIPKSIENQLKAYGQIRRLAGETRYETALAVAKAFFPETQNSVILTYSRNYPDALSAGPLAAKMNTPILLSANDNLAYAYNYAVDHKTKDIYIMGGESLISNKGAGGSQKNASEVYIGSLKYYVKSDSRMLQDATLEIEGIKYVAQKGGLVTIYGKHGIKGIDVSEHQGLIDWKKVKKDGVKFAFIRVGGRKVDSGRVFADAYGKTNIRNATKNGIKVGAYFFSQAITKAEALEEAKFTLEQIKGLDVTLPVVIDTEKYPGARHNYISRQLRTEICKVFCEYVESAGYKAMVYSNVGWLNNNLYMSQLSKYDVWAAQYYKICQYKGPYVCWQYTSSGSVSGIKGNVDMNIWYGGKL